MKEGVHMTSFEKTAKTIIAKTFEGEEYTYLVKETYQVSKQKADFICKVFNDTQYKMDPLKGEKWKVYTVSDYTYKTAFYTLKLYKNHIRIYENWTIYQ